MFSKQLKQYRKISGFTQEQLAAAIGTAKSTVSMYESGKREPDFETVKAISEALNVSMSLLIEGGQTGSRLFQIPVLGYVRAGKPVQAIEEVLGYEDYSSPCEDGEYFALQINGNSMEPRMYNGDTVIVKQQPDVDSGQIAVVLVAGEDATVKKVVKTGNGIALVALNTDYSPIFFSNEEVEKLPVTVIGKVVELRSRF